MNEETNETAPNWLSELEARRERRIKAKLGHETGAGSPCTTCKDCPGLDLHFWRKICKNCKCKKENHDIQDEDLHSWAQWELLGSKPNRNKRIVLPGRKDEVVLEWAPKGDKEIVEKYLKDLPPELLPVKGSAAAQERKQLLQQQLPVHDIDPTLCHALTDEELKKMNDYVEHVKDKSVGVGHVIQLNFNKAKFLSERTHPLIPNTQIVQLQGSSCTNALKAPQKETLKNLQNMSLNDDTNPPYNMKSHPSLGRSSNLVFVPKTATQSKIDERNPERQMEVKNITHPSQKLQKESIVSPKKEIFYTSLNFEPQNKQSSNLLPNQPYYNQIDRQEPVRISDLKNRYEYPKEIDQTPDFRLNNPDVGLLYENTARNPIYPKYMNSDDGFTKIGVLNEENLRALDEQNLPHYANRKISSETIEKNPHLFEGMRDLRYTPYSTKNHDDGEHDGYENPGFLNQNLPSYASSRIATDSSDAIPQENHLRDLNYRTYDIFEENLHPDNAPHYDWKNPRANRDVSSNRRPHNVAPSNINIEESFLDPTRINIGAINDVEFSTDDVKNALAVTNDAFEPIPHRKDDLILSKIPECHRCHKIFEDSDFAIGAERTAALWHANCFKCAGCNQPLADLLYFYDKETDNIYCGRDYAKIRGIPRCNACDELIFVKEYCLAESASYHLKHFCCYECDMPLAGHNYLIEKSQPLCLPCFEKLQANRCQTCKEIIKPDEEGASLKEVHFHANNDCFCCKTCRKPLLGSKFLFRNQNLYCSGDCLASDQ